MVIRRIEITFNEDEQDLLDYIESNPVRNATFIKHCVREHMKGNNSIVDYEKIRQIINEILTNQPKIPIHQPKQTANNQSKLLQNFSKKY